MFSYPGEIHVPDDVQGLLPPPRPGVRVPVGGHALVHGLLEHAVLDALLEVNLDGLVGVLRVVHPDAGGDPVHVRTLLLVPGEELEDN